jgi:hypothetical protein
MLKHFYNSFINALATNDALWFVTAPFAQIGHKMVKIRLDIEAHQKAQFQQRRLLKLLQNELSARTVLRGPFFGLKYPESSAVGSAFIPKILGTYESEIHPFLEEICLKQYSEIINIGSGEGYYAVGLALRMPKSKIYAFDPDADAQILTRKMAEINNVSKDISIDSYCTPEYLVNFKFTGRGLIVCDCEGCEMHLFRKAIRALEHCTLLIEAHDYLDLNISSELRSLFSTTHFIKSVFSIDDVHKASKYCLPETKDFSIQDKLYLFGEGRPSIMEWLYLKPKLDE